MRLLIVTQKIDINDPILGFFHRWVEEFSKHYKKITVVCLEKGDYNLPENVSILSLGKESKNSRFQYIFLFYKYILRERSSYDSVFIHMNQEYVLLGWWPFKLLSKRIYFWRNHAKGNIFTNIAVYASNKVFCTSQSSYTAKFKKTKLMPVGIDTDFYKADMAVNKTKDSVLFLGRISPVKKVLEFVEFLKNYKFEIATIAGPILPEDREYGMLVRDSIKINNLDSKVRFIGSVSKNEALQLYRSHEIYVNLTPSGSMDKTILEAAACETKILVNNPDLKILESKSGKELRDFVLEKHSLKLLMSELSKAIL